MFLDRLDQREQVHGSLLYEDSAASYPIEDAESLGKVKASGTDGAVLTAAPTNFSSTAYTFTAQNVGDFITIAGVHANAGTYKITAFIDANNVTCASASFTDESSLKFEVRQAQNLEDDMNYLRTQDKNILGTTNWFDAIPTYTDPKATGTPKIAHLSNIAGKTTDAKTFVDQKNADDQAVAATNIEITIADTTQYADATDRTGLPMADSGEYDETNYDATFVELIDPETGLTFRNGSGSVIWGRMIKGTELTNFKVKFYTGTNDGSATAYTWTASDPTSINVLYGTRVTLDDLSETFFRKKHQVAIGENSETAKDIDDLQSYTGGADGETAPTWTNTTATYALQANPTDLEGGINAINDAIGSRQYSTLANDIINDGDTITDSLEDLAEVLSDTTVEKFVEDVTTTINKETAHTLPSSETYTLDAGNNGLHMDVFLNGLLLASDGASSTRDYEETSTTSITFHGNVNASSSRPAVLTYIIRKA